MVDDDDNQSRLEFEPQPRFKSAKNSPYTERERQQLRQIVAQLNEEAEMADTTQQEQQNTLQLKNDTTMAMDSTFPPQPLEQEVAAEVPKEV